MDGSHEVPASEVELPQYGGALVELEGHRGALGGRRTVTTSVGPVQQFEITSEVTGRSQWVEWTADSVMTIFDRPARWRR